MLLNRLPELAAPALVVVVVDASNLQRNLYYATQVIELGYPTIVALNMVDVAQNNGHEADVSKLADELGVPVLAVIASEGAGVAQLRLAIVEGLRNPLINSPRQFCEVPEIVRQEAACVAALLRKSEGTGASRSMAEAMLILGNEKALDSSPDHYSAAVSEAVKDGRERLESAGVDWRGAVIEGRYASVSKIQQTVTTETAAPAETRMGARCLRRPPRKKRSESSESGHEPSSARRAW